MDLTIGPHYPEGIELSVDETSGRDAASEGQSVVRDGGDCFRLRQSTGRWNSERHRPTDHTDANTLTSIGAAFNNTPPTVLPSSPQLVISDSADSSQLLGEDVSKPPKRLDIAIRTALWPPKEPNQHFLPLDKLEKLVNIQTVFQELQTHDSFRHKPAEHLQDLANKVCQKSDRDNSTTTRTKIFGTLLLITRLDALEMFIEEDLWDKDLPFFMGDLEGYLDSETSQMFRKDRKPIRLFSTWDYFQSEGFAKNQWKFLAPFFKLPLNDDTRPLRYHLQKDHILPFIENLEHEESDNESGNVISGGTSEVFRVKIHPAHYNSAPNSNPYFAVKRFKPNKRNQIMFKKEVATLERLSGHRHPHLMQLQLTYEWSGTYNLLFTWADGNLKDYWESYPEPNELPRNKEYARWVSEQILGLTKGLQFIHQCPPDTNLDEESEGAQDDIELRRTRGRHGDLKPENILWFQQSLTHKARLVISDFGLTSFHRRETGKLNPENVGRTPTYRPPEYDTGRKITQSFDIWTWGCVLLELSVWYLKGFEEWDNFSAQRAEDHRGGMYQEDVYFNMDIRQNRRRAVLKKSVIEQFVALREDDNVPQFLVDLLGLIESRLLRMDLEDRATCDEIVARLETIHKNCLQSEDYCVRPVPGSHSWYRHPDSSQRLSSTTGWVSDTESDDEGHLHPLPLHEPHSDDNRSRAEDTIAPECSTNYSRSALGDTEVSESGIEEEGAEQTVQHISSPAKGEISYGKYGIPPMMQTGSEPGTILETSLKRKRKRDRILRIFCLSTG